MFEPYIYLNCYTKLYLYSAITRELIDVTKLKDYRKLFGCERNTFFNNTR